MESGSFPLISSVSSRLSNLETTRTKNDSSPCPITSLAVELVHYIFNYVPPASHLDFACTCKYLLACSSDVLKRHQNAQTKYGVSSDLDPVTIPTILRSVSGYGDPIPAWHVRSLEIWYERESWDEWKTLDFKNHISQDTSTPIAWEYEDDEIDDILKHLGPGSSSTEHMEQARTQIANGYDGILKAILLANLPRLRDVKFVMPWKGEVQNFSCLGWLTLFINDAYDLKTSWGAGLSSLHSVAVGLESKTWMDVDYDEPNTELLLQLLRLPNIDRIYFKSYRGPDTDEQDYSLMIPPGSSSVQHLFLDNCDDLGHDFDTALAAAPVSLLTAAFRAGPALLENADALVGLLGHHQGTSLQSLMFYGYNERGTIHGYRCNAFRPEELQDFRVLKHLCLNMPDIELDICYNESDQPEDMSHAKWMRSFFVECIPRSVEALVLWNGLSNDYIQWHPNEEEGFQKAIIHLIHDEEHSLSSVYLADVESRSKSLVDGRVRPNAIDHFWWRRAVDVGREMEVDVHTLANWYEPRFHHEFPEAMDEFDWATGPWGERPSDWVFDVHSGRRRKM
jgi:hypothetical protein